jgi:quinoprotein glucose dehydrogenase
VLAAVAVVLALPVRGQMGASQGEWRFLGGDAGSTKYSPLDQINRDNVRDLRIAWRWKTENFGGSPDYNYEATPLMVGGVLYTTAGSRRDVVAIDPATGETLWMFRHDEGSRALKAPIRPAAGRGVAYWTDGQEERILHVTRGYVLVALDAKTGRPIPTFGDKGFVDLYVGLDQPIPQDGQINWNSPPMVVRDTVVIGAALLSQPTTKEFPAGFIRGYDVRTGKRTWIFHTVPRPGEFGNETWEDDSWSYTGNTGAWAPMAADEELGYVYVPTESPTNDLYGGHRKGDGLFGETLLCLDARTGKRIWHYQITHHGLWDYDLPTAPILLDITVNGRRIKAVAQITKQAFTFVFDRLTGEPVWPIEERPVPQSDVPGEKSSRTQPFPTRPPPFDRQGVTADDLIDFTPELRAKAEGLIKDYKLGPLYTPPIVAGANGMKGVLMLPAIIGGANWQGGAVDPETGMLYVASTTNVGIAAVVSEPERTSMNYITRGGGSFAGDPDPRSCGMFGPEGLPLIKPPWGRITAIDLNTGSHAWMVPNGDTPDCAKNHPLLKGVDIPPTGNAERSGIMVTKTLVFAGEGGGLFGVPTSSGGPMFRAFDKRTGAVIAAFRLPANQTSIPMTYMMGNKQYIVVAVGARNFPAELVALTLP